MLLPRPSRHAPHYLQHTPTCVDRTVVVSEEMSAKAGAVVASAFVMTEAHASTSHRLRGVARVCRPRRYLDGARRAARGLGDRRARTASDLGDGVARRELRVPLPHLRRLLRDQVRGRVDAPYAGATDRAEAGARRDREEGDDDAQMHEPVADGRVDQSFNEDAKSRRGRLALLWLRGDDWHANHPVSAPDDPHARSFGGCRYTHTRTPIFPTFRRATANPVCGDVQTTI